ERDPARPAAVDQVHAEPQGDQDAADQHHEHHRVAGLDPRVELAERLAGRGADDRGLEQLLGRWHRSPQNSWPVPWSRCSTSGPRARTGKKVRAPMIRTTLTSRPTNSGVGVGKVPGPAGPFSLAARLPAMASTARMGR